MNPEFSPDKISKSTCHPNMAEFSSENGVVMRIYFLTDTLLRFRYTTDGIFEEDFSYAIDTNHLFHGITYACIEQDAFFELQTNALKLEINKSDLRLHIKTKEGETVLNDELGFHWSKNQTYGGNTVMINKLAPSGEYYYGMGDKPSQPNLRGRKFINWAMDEYGFMRETDPLYKCIPFYTAVVHGKSYGIFLDNTYKSHFDFACNRHDVVSFNAEGGEMNYYFIYGPEMIDVTRQYTKLTGVPELPPLWALGYHQCKWSYFPEAQVKEIANEFRRLDLPCDAIYFDIDYMDGFRCFTFDEVKFPDPKGLVSHLATIGFKTVAIIDPGIKIDEKYSVYNEAHSNDYFCRRSDGSYIEGKVWPGDCYFPDFTKPEVRSWWANLFQYLIEEVGINGIWNDMNEPALFEAEGKTFPMDVHHDYDGHPCDHRKAHNVYGMQMTRASYEGVKKFVAPNRPFLITRATYSGGQRFSSAWTGDNIATWEHLWLANVQCQRLCLSGFSFCGSDIGGFIDQPTPELYVRWIQLAVFHPFFRTHSSGDHGDQEPWSFGEEALNIVRKFIKLRYAFLPYIYTTFYQYVKYGTPMLRPICMYDQHDADTLYRGDETLMGDHILVCPILEEKSKGRYIYLPKGSWYSYWDDMLLEGGKEHFLIYGLETSPIFIKAGAVIPNFPCMAYVGEKTINEITLHIYFANGTTTSHLYEDAGDGYDYEKGASNEKTLTQISEANKMTILQETIGQFSPEYKTYHLTVHGLHEKCNRIIVDDSEILHEKMHFENGKLSITVSESFRRLEVEM